jgi:outer membrane receptor for ferrienterochelin and colicin
MKKGYMFAPLLFILFFVASIDLSAQTTVLSGKVKDSKGEPVIGATIQLRGYTVGAAADLEGNYRFTTTVTGTVQIMASASGMKTIVRSIALSGRDQNEDFVLEEDLFNLDQIVVTGTSTSRTQKEMTGSLAQISAKQIQAVSANSMADILRIIPGVHAEGGGGDVASNILVRGMPSGGQYKYTPIEEDGMPVQSTGYLTSSAQDVFFRPDMGVANLEFARGGSSTLFGVGSPLGVFNYISKKGGGEPESTVKLTAGQYSLVRLDFSTGGSVGEKWQYHLGGFTRYDEGPQPTGAASRGYQLRGNITRQLENGYLRFYFRTLDDNAQFYLPFPHVKNTTDAATGNDGKEVSTLYSPQMGTFSLVNPLGTTQGNLGNGVTAKGNSFMLEFANQFGGWELKSKTRLSRFEHRFDFWAPGKTFEIDAYARSKSPILQSYNYTYADNGLPLNTSTGANNGKTYVSENSITLRNRPLTDYSTDLRLTRNIKVGGSEHNLTVGTFAAITRQLQDETGTGVLVELADQPRLVDLTVLDTTGKTTRLTRGGFRQNVAGRTYNSFEADKIALYAGDEMVFGKMRLDVGVRYEKQKGIVTVGETAAYTNPNAATTADATYRWQTGKVITRTINSEDFGFVVGANYALKPSTNVYASFTKGFYFPELRTFSNINRDGKGNFIQVVPDKNEALYQFETGLKYSARSLSGTLALYYNNIQNRLQNDIIAGTDGVLREITIPVGSVTSYGTEISLAYQITNGLIIDANTTLQNHQYDDFKKTTSGPDATLGTADDVVVDYKGNWTLRQPKFLFNAGLTFDKKNWDLGVMFNYEGKRFADDQNLVELPAYSIINFRAGKTFPVGDTNQSIKIGLNLYNALNNRGLTEGDPRVADTSVVANDPFYNARPILPRRLMAFVMFKF